MARDKLKTLTCGNGIVWAVPPCFVAVSLLGIFPALFGLAMCCAGVDERIAMISVVLTWGGCCRVAWRLYAHAPQKAKNHIRYVLYLVWFVAQGFTLAGLLAQIPLLLLGIEGWIAMVIYLVSCATGFVLGGFFWVRVLNLGIDDQGHE